MSAKSRKSREATCPSKAKSQSKEKQVGNEMKLPKKKMKCGKTSKPVEVAPQRQKCEKLPIAVLFERVRGLRAEFQFSSAGILPEGKDATEHIVWASGRRWVRRNATSWGSSNNFSSQKIWKFWIQSYYSCSRCPTDPCSSVLNVKAYKISSSTIHENMNVC